MASNDLEPGQSRVGYAWDDKISDPYPAMLRDRDGRIELVIPFDADSEVLSRRYLGDMVEWGDDPDMTRHDYDIPNPLWFCDAHGFVCLVGTRRSGGLLIGGPTNLNESVLRVSFAVFTGNPGVSYTRVNGFRTQLEGLAEWYGIRTVTNSLDGPRPSPTADLTVTIKRSAWNKVDARLNLSLGAGARYESSEGIGRTSIDSWGATRTRSARPRNWSDHLERHRLIHRLVELSAWSPLGFEQIKAMHIRDPDRVLSGKVVGERWATVRTYELLAPGRVGSQLWFLFTYADIGAAGIRRWLTLREEFRRGVDAMTFSIRHCDTSLDGLISDAGIGLEEIGHGIQLEAGGVVSRAHHRKLEAIAAEVADLLPFDGSQWATRSTEVYNDVKHADRPPADIDAMVESLKHNRIVFRTWLARRLGVKDDVIRKGKWLLDRS